MRADIFFIRGNSAAVVGEAEVMLTENQRSDYAYVAAARMYARIDRKADAMKAFDAALAMKPQAYIYLNRAQIRPFTDYRGRLADLDAALRLDPKDVDTLAEKAEQLAVTGNAKEALKLYDQVHQLAPANDYLALRRAILLYKSGTTSEAEKVITAQHAKAKTATDLNHLCWTKATAGILLESALQDCLESLKLKPDSIQTLDSLAFVDLRLGKTDEAITMYSKAIAGNSGSASYMGRSIAYARKGDKVHSDADRAEAMRLDHDAETRFAEYGLKR
jgi:tetratricopeptide (TPR) repeat protein